MLDVSPDNLTIIRQILQQFVPDCEVRAFGSRVNGEAKPYSDLDLAIAGKEKIKRRTKMLLREAFAESDLPFRVEVLDYNAVSKEFRQIINKQYEVIQEKSDTD
jgi:predicted nucleotidyltransferase